MIRWQFVFQAMWGFVKDIGWVIWIFAIRFVLRLIIRIIQVEWNVQVIDYFHVAFDNSVLFSLNSFCMFFLIWSVSSPLLELRVEIWIPVVEHAYLLPWTLTVTNLSFEICELRAFIGFATFENFCEFQKLWSP